MWLPLEPTASPLSMHGEVRSRNFPIYVLNDSHKTLQARAKVIQVSFFYDLLMLFISYGSM